MSVVTEEKNHKPRSAVAAISVLTMLLAMLGIVTPAQAAVDDGTLTVSVSRTFTEVGIADPAQDVPQEGMQVLVTDAAGASVSGVTGPDGNFVLAPDASLSGGQYRIEVVIPEAYDYLEPAFAALGETYRSHVGFVDLSSGTDVTYRTAVWNPADYIQVAPEIAVPFQSGQGAVGSTQALVEFPSSPRGNTPPRTTTNTQGQVGNIYGTAYDRYNERIFSSAYAKRHTQYGTGGSGAIYVSPLSSSSAELFATIPNAGATEHTVPLRSDVSFFTAPGRESLGDIELSEDGSTLWVVNLNDQNLYALDAATGDILSNALIPNPGCVGGEWHPMGLGVQDGLVYVGGICDAFDSQLRTDLMASVYQTTDGVSFTKVLDHSLDFLRGRVNDPGVVDVNTHWNPWYDEFDPSKYYSAWVHAFPQPLLSDIDFDRDGSLLLGFRDRFSDQIGFDGLAPDGRHEGSGSSAAGDIIMVCLIDGGFVWEGEGACPSNVIPEYTGGTANALTSEYFVGESVLGSNHQEPGLGSIAPIFRQNDVVMTTIDPRAGAWQQGVQYLDLDDGTGAYSQGGRGGSERGQLLSSGALTFGKGNGLGDLSILADPAPIQIGNVVWFDDDKDGTQDPNEVPLPGVTVDLLDADGTTVLATAVTDDAGEYYFSSLDTPLTPNGEFRVQFTKPDDGITVDLGGDHGLVDWAHLNLTDQTQGTNTSIDSNADPASGITGPIQTGAPGADDHTIDAGYILPLLPGYEHGKTSDPVAGTPVQAGDTITYTVTGSNTGELPLDVDITDDLSDVLAGAAVTSGPTATVYSSDGEPVAESPAASVAENTLTWTGSVPSMGSVAVVYTVTVDEDVVPGTIFENRMSSVATPPPGDWPETIEPDPVSIAHPVPGFEHSKVADPIAGTAVAGTAPNNTITYTVRGENTGATSLDVVMADDLSSVLLHNGVEIGAVTNGPDTAVYNADGSPSAAEHPVAEVDGTDLTWAGELAQGQYVEVIYTVTLNEATPGNIVIQNTLSSTATPPGGDPITPDEVYVEHPTPDYAHSKTAVPASGTSVLPGDTITYKVTGYNSGAAELDVEVSDDLSDVLAHAGLVGDITYTVYSSGDSAVSNGTVELNGTDLFWSGPLAVGERVEIVYTVQVAEDVKASVVIRNAMTSEANAGDELILPDPPEIVTEHPIAGYAHAKSSDPVAGTPVHAGEDITYTLTGANTGSERLDPVVVTDDLSGVSPYATLGSGDFNGVVLDADGAVISTTPVSVDGDVITWTGVLEPGEHVEIVYTVTVDADVVGTLVNHLSSEATPEGSNEPITPPDVELAHPIPGYEHAKSSDPVAGTPVVSGDEITYTISGTNTGATALNPVELVDDLSGVLVTGVTLLGDPVVRLYDSADELVTDGVPSAELDGTDLTWVGSLEVGERVEISYTVLLGDTVAPGTVLMNTFTSSATEPSGGVITPEEEIEQHPVPGIDIVKFDARDTDAVPANPVDGPAAVGTTPGDWAPGVDADTAFDGAQYEVGDDGKTGPQQVGMIVTNIGAVPLSNIVVSDETLDGPALTDVVCDFSSLGGPSADTAWAGPLAPGASFTCVGTLELTAPETHADRASVDADAVVELPNGETATVPVSDEDDYFAGTPDGTGVDITKRDAASGAEADTTDDALIVPADTTRTVEMPVRNTGDVPLRHVVIGDETTTGPALANLTCTFPNGDVVVAGSDGIARWEASFTDPEIVWAAGVEFLCTGELTISGDEPWHADTISVGAETLTGESVGDDDPFVAGVPSIDVVKFDGRVDAPANPVDGPSADGATPGDWSPDVDADTAEQAVLYGLDGDSTGPQPVGVVVTNTGAAPLTNVSVTDETLAGSDLTGLVCDFSTLGGPSSGTSWAGPFQPGDAFTCVGTVELGVDEEHANSISVVGDAVVTDVDGEAVDVTVTDSDDYFAKTGGLAATGGAIIGTVGMVLLVGLGLTLFLVGRRRRSEVSISV